MEFAEIISILQTLILPVLGILGYFVKQLLARLDHMEKELKSFITHQEARVLVEDMQEPLKVSLRNVEYLLNRILNELEKKH